MNEPEKGFSGKAEAEKESTEIVSGLPLMKVAGAVEAAAGIFFKENRAGLLGIAQAAHDMEKSGQFGTGLSRVLRCYFPLPAAFPHDESIEAVREVFLGGKRRNEEWKILAFLPISKYRNRKSDLPVPDRKKAAHFFEKYDYLGFDKVNSGEGFFYFGEVRRWSAEVGSYILQSNADRALSYLESKGIPAFCRFLDGKYILRVGRFEKESDAVNYLPLLEALGFIKGKTVYDY